MLFSRLSNHTFSFDINTSSTGIAFLQYLYYIYSKLQSLCNECVINYLLLYFGDKGLIPDANNLRS